MKILVVDDEASIQELASRRLAASGLEISQTQFALDLHEAGNKALTFSPDVILLDLTLPDSAREQTIQAIRHLGKRYCVIVFTGHDSSECWRECISAGAMDYVTKIPFLAPGNEGFLGHVILTAYWLWSAQCRSE